LRALLSDDYIAARRAELGTRASHEFRPGGAPDWTPDYAACATRQRAAGMLAAYGGGEPTIIYDDPEEGRADGLSGQEQRDYLNRAVGDTSYLAVSDADGNVVSATPSGGWLQSSPVIPELGFALGTRAQMMWLEDKAPSALAPATPPRTTLTPTIAISSQGDVLALGTPGGDQQEQWQIAFLARHLAQGLPLQAALDAPGFHTNHVVNSFYPRGAQPGSLVVEDRFDAEEIEALRARGHDVSIVDSWVEGRLCAVRAGADGSHVSAVSTRGGQALAVAR
jgi:gamma-glutamyltranspeptidase/glutathione hydrolase